MARRLVGSLPRITTPIACEAPGYTRNGQRSTVAQQATLGVANSEANHKRCKTCLAVVLSRVSRGSAANSPHCTSLQGLSTKKRMYSCIARKAREEPVRREHGELSIVLRERHVKAVVQQVREAHTQQSGLLSGLLIGLLKVI